MWIVVGDIPPAYLSWEDCRSGKEAFDTYIAGMEKWVQFAREGQEGTAEDCVAPVNVPATPEWAEALESRLRSLRELVQPLFR